MRHHRSRLAILLVLSAFGASAGDAPSEVVEAFYAWAIQPAPEERERGLAAVQLLLGRELLAALEAQRTYEAVCAQLVRPGLKPYMLDQSPFFLWPDGAQALVSHETRGDGTTARVSAQLAYDDLQWTDTVVLRREGDRWAIVDIEWQAQSLTQRLVEFAEHRCAP